MKLFTIGYQDKTLTELLLLLEKVTIKTLIDVREKPFSRKKGFSKKELQKALAERGINYLHLKGLGAPPWMREKVRESGDYNRFFDEYNSCLQDNLHLLSEITELLEKGNCCLLCLEADPGYCHRKVVAEKMSRLNPAVEVTHL